MADGNFNAQTGYAAVIARPPSVAIAASVATVAVFWLMSSNGYYYLVAYLRLDSGYNDAPVLFAGNYLLWTILALIWFRPVLSVEMRHTSLPGDILVVLPLVAIIAAFIVIILPALPHIAVWRAPVDPPEFMFASAWYYLPKSFDILFQQILIATMIRTAAGQGFGLVTISLGKAILFGAFHLMLAFDGYTPTYVARFSIAATAFGAVAPYLYLWLRRGFFLAYGLHWSFYTVDAVTTHFVLAVPISPL